MNETNKVSFLSGYEIADNKSEKYHFDCHHKWVAKSSDTKRIAVRKIKAFLMNLTAEVEVLIDDSNSTQQHIKIYYALIRIQPITHLLICIIRKINKFIDTLYPGIFPSFICYLWTDSNNGKSTVIFTSLLLAQLNTVIVFGSESLKSLNNRQNHRQLIALVDNQRVAIAFNSNNCYSFEA
jgi:hypothetical protein